MKQLALFPCGTVTTTHPVWHPVWGASGAEFSPDRLYRWRLWRIWDRDRAPLVFVGLNPSTADDVKNDPTVTRCIRRAQSGGYGGLIMLNVFAWRATDPAEMLAAEDPIGSENDRAIAEESRGRDVVAAWGVDGSHRVRSAAVLRILNENAARVLCLGTTADGSPRHPLYVAYAKTFEEFNSHTKRKGIRCQRNAK